LKGFRESSNLFRPKNKRSNIQEEEIYFQMFKKNPSHELFFEYADIFRQRDFQTKVEKIFW
jgi:DNA-binding XRE family transcriptional regulator